MVVVVVVEEEVSCGGGCGCGDGGKIVREIKKCFISSENHNIRN